MADQDNSTRRPQREAKRRAVAALSEHRKRKRVALGDITNDVVPETEKLVSDANSHNHRQKKKKRNIAGSPVPKKLEDPQLCEPYVTDIHDYLRNLEVSVD